MLRRDALRLLFAGLLCAATGPAYAGLAVSLPKAAAPQDTQVLVNVRATATGLFAADMAILIDTSFVLPGADFLRRHRFSMDPQAAGMWNRVKDTVFVSIATAQPVDLEDGVLATLAFDVAPTAPVGATTPLTWVSYPDTRLNEEPATTTDGELFVLPEGARRPVITSFDVALLRMPGGEPPFGADPVPLVRAEIHDENGTGTVDTVFIDVPGVGRYYVLGSENGRYAFLLPAVPGYAGGVFRMEARDETGLYSLRATDNVPVPDQTVPLPLSPPDDATEVPLDPRLDWRDVLGAREYRVHLSAMPIESQQDLFNPGTTVLSFLNTTTSTSELRVPPGMLQPMWDYYWIVGAFDDAVDPDDVTLCPVQSFTTRLDVVELDRKAPVLLDAPVANAVDDASIAVRWVTNESSTTRVVYWKTSDGVRDSTSKTDLVTDHSVLISALGADTEYRIEIVSSDVSGNVLRRELLRAVRTKKAPDFDPPDFVAPPMVEQVTTNSVVISWRNDEPASAVVRLTSTAGDSLVEDARSVPDHQLTIDGLTPGTAYGFAVQSIDQSGNVSPYRPGQPFVTKQLADVRPPRVIKRPVSVPGETGVIISWAADELHTAEIVIQPPAGPAMQVYSDAPALAHLARTSGLTPATEYEYIVTVTDVVGNSIASRPYRFRTLAQQDTDPPRILRGPLVEYVADTRGLVGWLTDEPSDSYVELFKDGELVGTFGDGDLVRLHRVVLTQLDPGSSYNFVIHSADASGNEVVYPPSTASRPGRISGRAGGSITTSTDSDSEFPVVVTPPSVVSTTTNSVTVQWTTDEPANSVVRFGESGSAKAGRAAATLGQSVSYSEFVTEHSVTITGLDAGMSYSLQTANTDVSGNGETLSSTFTASTPNQEDLTAPEIVSGPEVISSTDTRITVRWVTDELADSEVRYCQTGTEDEESEVVDSELATEHVVTLTNLTAGTSYDLTVASTDLLGNGPTEATLSASTGSGADETAPNITNGPSWRVDATRAWVSWTTDEPADSYLEFGATADRGRVASSPDLSGDHELVLTNLSPATDYYLLVASADASSNLIEQWQSTGGDTLKLTTAATPDETPPAVVSGLSATAGATEVKLSWSPVSDEDLAGYNVDRSSGGDYVEIARLVEDAAYVDRTVVAGTSYSYRIRSEDNSAQMNVSEPSTSVAALPQTTNVPSAPDAIAHSGDVSSRPVLKALNATAGVRLVASYSFVVASDSELSQVIATASAVEEGTDTTLWQLQFSLEHQKEYWWAVRARDTEGFSGPLSAINSFVVDTNIAVGVFLSEFSAEPAGNAVRIQWKAICSDGTANFRLWRAPEGGESTLASREVFCGAETHSFLDVGTTPGMTYEYRLESWEGSGDSRFFGPITVTAGLPAHLTLRQNVPNPFNPSTALTFELPRAGDLRLEVFNALGQRVKTLASGLHQPGIYRVAWHGMTDTGKPAGSGVYFARLSVVPDDPGSSPIQRVVRMMLVK